MSNGTGLRTIASPPLRGPPRSPIRKTFVASHPQHFADRLPAGLPGRDSLAPARADLVRQARAAGALGSPFVRDVLMTLARHLDAGPLLAARLAQWPGDRAAAALALRVNGALHALARSGRVPGLSELYAARGGDFDAAIICALREADAELTAFLDHPTQTNEVARSSALIAGLMTGAAPFGHPVELLELGASAGLNLLMMRYAHDLGGTAAGDPASPVRLRPHWHGQPPARHALRLVAAAGVDLAPLDVTDPAACERLLAWVWADRDDRSQVLVRALQLARQTPPEIDRGDAADWLERRLALPQPAGTTRAVMHSMLWQYLDPASRARIDGLLAAAGARADHHRPLLHLAYEWDNARQSVELTLTTWPDGAARRLATLDPYGDWIAWTG